MSSRMPRKTIKDSIHDHVEIGGVALELLDTPAVQRLRHVKQLGTVELVYPSANHTRFEHSLGVYHLAAEAAAQLDIDEPAATHVRAAALLHDIGHPPYSHNLETLIERRTGTGGGDGKFHEDIGDRLRRNEFVRGAGTGQPSCADVLAEHGLDPDRIADLVAGEGRYGGLVSGALDVDRMDYLVRDAHHTGIPSGLDPGRLIRELDFVDGQLVLAEGTVQTAVDLLFARHSMNVKVYNHHVARISKAMQRRAAECLLEADDDLDGVGLARMDDHDLQVALRSHEETAPLARRLDYRDLFKRAVWIPLDAVPADVREGGHETRRALEAELADEAGVDPETVIVDEVSGWETAASDVRVLVDGEPRNLSAESSVVRALAAEQERLRTFGVYTEASQVDGVGRVVEERLGLDLDGGLVNDRRRRPAGGDSADGPGR